MPKFVISAPTDRSFERKWLGHSGLWQKGTRGLRYFEKFSEAQIQCEKLDGITWIVPVYSEEDRQ